VTPSQPDMHDVHMILAESLDWLAAPLRIGLVSVLVLVLAFALGRVLLRFAGGVLARGAVPAAELLTYPEYLITSLCRRLGCRPLPGSYLYGRTLGALAKAAAAVGASLQRPGRHRPRLLWMTLVVVIGVMAAAWFTKTESIPTSLRPATAVLRADIARLDGWLITGLWKPAPTIGCPAPAK